jgi:Leucine-rich repeat (LRR) protein
LHGAGLPCQAHYGAYAAVAFFNDKIKAKYLSCGSLIHIGYAMFNTNSFEFTSVLEAYRILNIPLSSSFLDVKKAYKKGALEYHPDKNRAEGSDEKFKLIANAYGYLEQFKDKILENRAEILKFKENNLASSNDYDAKDVPTTKAQADVSSQPTKECTENVREQQRKLEIAQLLSVFQKNPFSTIMNQDQLYALLIQKVSSTLLSESQLLEPYIDNFIQNLHSIQINLIDHLKTEMNYVQSRCFAECEIRYQARIQLLKNYVTAINEDLQILEEKKSTLSLYSTLVQSHDSNKVANLIALHTELENINTRIASIQLSNHYNAPLDASFEEKSHLPSRQLKLNFLTRLTDDFFSQANQLNEYFTGLDLTNNKLFRLSHSVTHWQSLRSFEMNNSPLIGFPNFITQLKNVEKLNLEANEISDLPTIIQKLTKLTELNLGKNNLNNLPSSIRRLWKLKKLDLNDNHFKLIPKQIGKLNNLRYLNFANVRRSSEVVSKNSITELPSDLKNLVNLEILNLNGNKLQFIPECMFEKWKNLKELHITNNNLATLPKNFGDLANLTFTDASDNCISFIPSSILKRKGKQFSLNLSNNVLHQHHLAVEAILIQMGWCHDKIKAFIDDQSPYEVTPMSIDGEFGFDSDNDLKILEKEYHKFLQDKENEQRWLMLSKCFTYFPNTSQFAPEAPPTWSPLLKDFLQRKATLAQPQFQMFQEFQEFDAELIQNLILG